MNRHTVGVDDIVCALPLKAEYTMCTWNISTTLFQVLLGSSHVTPIHIPPLFRRLAWDLMAHSREWRGQVMGMCCCIIRELLCVCVGVVVMVCGDVGTGKSTLCRFLVNYMMNRFANFLACIDTRVPKYLSIT